MPNDYKETCHVWMLFHLCQRQNDSLPRTTLSNPPQGDGAPRGMSQLLPGWLYSTILLQAHATTLVQFRV